MTHPDDRTQTPPASPYATGGYIPPTHNLITGQPIPAPKKKSRLPLIIAAAVGLVILIVVTVTITLAAQRGTEKTASSPAAAPAYDAGELGVDTAPAVEPEPTPPAATPKVKDIALTAKITDKQCFGSAGCNVTFNVDAEYVGPLLSEDDTWLVTYQVNGVDDGPVIGSFEFTGTKYTVTVENVGTKSSKSKITIKVTDVEKVGI